MRKIIRFILLFVIVSASIGSIAVVQPYGMPRIDSVTATDAIKYSTSSILTIKVTNTNTGGSDNFQVTSNAEFNGFSTIIIKAPYGNILEGGQQGTWQFELTPTGITQSNTVSMIATATSSAGQDTKEFTVRCDSPPTPENSRIQCNLGNFFINNTNDSKTFKE